MLIFIFRRRNIGAITVKRNAGHRHKQSSIVVMSILIISYLYCGHSVVKTKFCIVPHISILHARTSSVTLEIFLSVRIMCFMWEMGMSWPVPWRKYRKHPLPINVSTWTSWTRITLELKRTNLNNWGILSCHKWLSYCHTWVASFQTVANYNVGWIFFNWWRKENFQRITLAINYSWILYGFTAGTVYMQWDIHRASNSFGHSV